MADDRTMSDPPDRPRLPQTLAVALEYEKQDELPRIVSAGVGELARSIVSIAEQHGTPVTTNGPLAELLIQAGIGSTIPPESFRAVAEIVCFLYSVETKELSR